MIFWPVRIGSALLVACALASCGADDDAAPKPACVACAASAYDCSSAGSESVRFDVSLEPGGCMLTTKQLLVPPSRVTCEPLKFCTATWDCVSAAFADQKLTTAINTMTCHGHF